MARGNNEKARTLKFPGRDRSWTGDYATCGSCHLAHAAQSAHAPHFSSVTIGEYPIRTRLVNLSTTFRRGVVSRPERSYFKDWHPSWESLQHETSASMLIPKFCSYMLFCRMQIGRVNRHANKAWGLRQQFKFWIAHLPIQPTLSTWGETVCRNGIGDQHGTAVP